MYCLSGGIDAHSAVGRPGGCHGSVSDAALAKAARESIGENGALTEESGFGSGAGFGCTPVRCIGMRGLPPLEKVPNCGSESMSPPVNKPRMDGIDDESSSGVSTSPVGFVDCSMIAFEAT